MQLLIEKKKLEMQMKDVCKIKNRVDQKDDSLNTGMKLSSDFDI